MATAASFVSERAEGGHAHRAARGEESRDQRHAQGERKGAEREIRADDEDRRWIRARVQLPDDAVDELTAGKAQRKTSTFMVHDEKNEAKPGDIVEIVETRPLSRRKRWSLKRVVRQAVEV